MNCKLQLTISFMAFVHIRRDFFWPSNEEMRVTSSWESENFCCLVWPRFELIWQEKKKNELFIQVVKARENGCNWLALCHLLFRIGKIFYLHSRWPLQSTIRVVSESFLNIYNSCISKIWLGPLWVKFCSKCW